MTRLAGIDLRLPPDENASALRMAARRDGFFYLAGHGVAPTLSRRLEVASRRFFALPEATKARCAMTGGGRAWRGWFPLGDELTSGRPDWKEGLYLGLELDESHPRVAAGVPLHGRNRLPDDSVVPDLRAACLEWIAQVTEVGQRVLEIVARSLDLPPDWFRNGWTADPLVLFRVFLYPSRPVPTGVGAAHGVGEHTDYGLLTLLWQDDVGGLQVRTDDGWLDVPPRPGTFVCNVGDMLERVTGGWYRSAAHRVLLNASGRDRLSWPLFLDPGFDVRIERLATPAPAEAARAGPRWDGRDLHAFDGTYGDYVLEKIGRVFPDLRTRVL